jgi:FkbM family methyltransferase
MDDLIDVELKCFGSQYGHWCFIHHDGLQDCLIVSAGVGEDISFDVDFASEYNATVVLYDPTPRAIRHFETVCENFGKSSTIDYVPGGDQPVETYDLSNLSESNFCYKKYAVWNEKRKVKFFTPTNPEHVSHSILNYQRDYNYQDKSFIDVDTVKLSDEIKQLEKFPSIIKLDIEAAVLEVLEDLFSENIFVDQICVEYDEHHNPNFISMDRIKKMNKLFEDNNYQCVHRNGSDYLFANKDFLNSIVK